MPLSDRFSINENSEGSYQSNIIATLDINNDGILDFVTTRYHGGTEFFRPSVYLSNENGSYNIADNLIPNDVSFQNPETTVADFNNDGHLDIAVFDAGFYDFSIRAGLGNPPVLLLGSASGAFAASDILANAVLNADDNSYLGAFSDADLHIKDVTSADIDNDGDIDLWVESTGGDNITNHFMINEGGTFVVDPSRISGPTLFGTGDGDYWRYGTGELADVNGDGAPDLLLGQIRDNDNTHINQSSYVILNDGNGYFPETNRLTLPLPDFYYGYTAVEAILVGDLVGDGAKELLLSHTRNDDVSGPEAEQPWQGRFLQVLTREDTGSYVDISNSVFGSQSLTENPSDTQPNAPRDLSLFDVNADGALDIVSSLFYPYPKADSPTVALSNANGRFEYMDTGYWTDNQQWWGEYPLLRDFNGDGLLDLAHFDHRNGPNNVFENGGGDDQSALIVQFALPGTNGNPGAHYSRGTDSDDIITLARGATESYGLAGNDEFNGTSNDERIDGGADFDTYVLKGKNTDYSIINSGSVTIIRDTKPDGDGIDTVVNVERFTFTNGTLAFDLDINAGQTYRLYQAAFDRTPDDVGISHNVNLMDRGLSIFDMASAFIHSAEFQQTYGENIDDTAFITLLYRNVLDRDADTAGLMGWQDTLNSGSSREQVLFGFSESAENKANVAAAIEDGIWLV